MAQQGTTSFDFGHHSMLRIIRSARSRLGRESSLDDLSKNSGSSLAVDRPKRTSLSRSAFGRSRLSRCNGAGQANSENAAPEKPPQLPTGASGILSDVTNIAVVPTGVQSFENEAESKSKAVPCSLSAFGANALQNYNCTSSESEILETDAQHADNPQHVIEYLPDIMRTLEKGEKMYMVTPGYMECQAHVNPKMRGILVDWLVSVQQKYKLKADTLFLAVGVIDSYLEVRATPRKYLQLVGITSLLIAAKFEEIYPPRMNDFVYVTDKAYSKEEIAKMEVLILAALNFRVCRPTAVQFLERYQSVNGCDDTHNYLAQYLLELSLVDYNMVKYSPSHVAAAAVLLSNKLLRHQPSWKEACVKHTKLTEQKLKECAKEMCALLEHAEHNSMQAVRKKFSNAKYHSVAKLTFSGAPATPPATGDRRRCIDGREHTFAMKTAVGGA
jgi:cyclin B